jgi:DNA invertase Pin-like site-specific DNA recombinase
MRTHQTEARRRKVVIYCRISDDREGKRYGVDRQERDCRKRADRNGWDVVAVLVENDISAYSGKPRPKYQELLRMLRDGEADAVLSLSGKRLQRQYKDAFEFLDLVERLDIAVDTIKAGEYNLNTAEGRGRARRAAIDAQEESEEIGERVRDAKADNVAAGTYRGGPRPFGYEADGVTLRLLQCPQCDGSAGFDNDRLCLACGTPALNTPGSEAWYIEKATDTVVSGGSLASIERDWGAAGVRTVARRYRQPDGSKGEPEDRPWKREEIRKLLLRPRNAGLMEVSLIGPDGKRKSEIVGRAGWPPAIKDETWQACRAILLNPERRTTTGNGRKWLGGGLYDCYCGSKVRGSTTGIGGTKKAEKASGRIAEKAGITGAVKVKTHKPAYRCNASSSHAVRDAHDLDQYIERLVLERLSRPDAADLLLPPRKDGEERESTAATANALRAKLASFSEDYAADLITRQQMLDGTALTRKRLEKVEAKLAALASTSVLASLPLGTPEVETEWEGFDIDKKQSIIRALMTVTIHKARRGRPVGFKPGTGQTYFDESTIAIDWKHG